MRISPARELALDLLNRVFHEDAYANLLLPNLLRKANLDERDSAFSQELGFSTIRWKLTYDRIINQVSSRPTSDMDGILLNCLRLGTHQLLQMRVPAHAAISETVEMVRRHCGEKVVGFANGILRTISKQSFDQWITEITEGLSEVEKLSLKYSHPVWIVQALKQSLVSDGIAAELESLLATNNQPASVNLLALPGLAERAEYQDVAENNLHSPYGFHIKSGNPAELRGFAERYIRVQDEGSQLAALSLLEGKPVVAGELWLDMCAGPGGKAAFLAGMAKQRGVQLVANELQEHRADLVRDALSNFPESAKVSNFDGRELGKSMPDKFDRILVDAPCSGLGALRRRPEARWRKSNEDLKQLTALQFELIESASKALKPGGILLYVTCSPHLSETTAIIDRARRQLPLEVLDLTQSINEKYLQGALPSGRKTVQLHTQRDNTDSMFMALMTKPE